MVRKVTILFFVFELLIITLGRIDYFFSQEKRTTILFDYIYPLFFIFLLSGFILTITNTYLYIKKDESSMLQIFISVIISLLPLIVVSMLLIKN